MKFRLLLWLLGRLLAGASRRNPEFREQLQDRDLVFQLQTRDGRIARHFVVRGRRIRSAAGTVPQPAFSIVFRDAAYGFATLTADNRQLAFMQGIQNRDIQISGNPALVLWFQGLVQLLEGRKKQAA
ncbi:helicase [Pseudomonas stutzeri]|nr:helicase [Stutzerimonas stutzeri]